MIDRGSAAIDVSDPDLAGAAGVDALMARLRSLAQQLNEGTDWSRCDDHQVIALLQGLGVQAEGPPAAVSLYRIAAQAAPTPAAASAPASGSALRRPGAAAGPAPAAPAAAPSLDSAAMAAVLRQAARDGVPFCEECLRDGAEA